MDHGCAFLVGARAPAATPPFRCNVCIALDAAKRCATFVGAYKVRRDPTSVRRGIFAAFLWVAGLCRVSPGELRSAWLRARRRQAPPSMSGLGGGLGQRCGVPSDSTSLLLMTAQFSGAGAPSERVAMESVDRIRLSRAPYMKYKFLLPNGAQPMGRTLEYFRRVAKQTDSALARAVATEREFICDSIRAFYAPHAVAGKGLAPPGIRPEGLVCALGAPRALSRMVKDAARAETPSLRASDACYGYLIKYNPPVPKDGTVQANTPQSSTPTSPKIRAPAPKRSMSPARAQKAGPRSSFSDRSLRGVIRVGAPPPPVAVPVERSGSTPTRFRGKLSARLVLLRGAPVKTKRDPWQTNAVIAARAQGPTSSVTGGPRVGMWAIRATWCVVFPHVRRSSFATGIAIAPTARSSQAASGAGATSRPSSSI